MHHTELLKLLSTVFTLTGSTVYMVLFIITQQRLQYLYPPALSCSHSLRYGRNGLVGALAGCWDM